MSKGVIRGAVLVACVILSAGAIAAPRDGDRGPRERTIPKIMRGVVRILGDLITVPIPAPKP